MTFLKVGPRNGRQWTGELAIPLVESPDFEIISTVLRLAQGFRLQLTEMLAAEGVTWARYEVLDLLCRYGPASYATLAQQLSRHRTSIAATVDGLADAQYVRKSLTSTHSQQWVIEATGSGEMATERAEQALHRVRLATKVDRETILAVLRSLDDNSA